MNARDSGEPINDAGEKFGIEIVEADVAEGDTYWKVIGVHHLLPRENFSNHHVYLEALDEAGQRIRNPFVWAGFQRSGRGSSRTPRPL